MPKQQNIEYKSLWHDDSLKWICGFANAQGGRIYIGKDDVGAVIDLKDGSVSNSRKSIIFASKNMIHYEEKRCPHCGSNELVKNGKTRTGTQHRRCKKCNKYFQYEYSYNACKQGVKEQITDMTLNGSGVRDIGRVLKINKNTVVSVLKKNSKNEPIFFNGG
jgi:transposase-like protein